MSSTKNIGALTAKFNFFVADIQHGYVYDHEYI